MKMAPEGFVEYKRREFCKNVQCPVQIQLSKITEASHEYEQTRQKCGTACLYTTWQFHHWLIEKGYIILANSKLKNNEQTVLANLDNGSVQWMEQQVQKGKYRDKSHLIKSAIAQYKKDQE
jgi:hypothetical protein